MQVAVEMGNTGAKLVGRWGEMDGRVFGSRIDMFNGGCRRGDSCGFSISVESLQALLMMIGVVSAHQVSLPSVSILSKEKMPATGQFLTAMQLAIQRGEIDL